MALKKDVSDSQEWIQRPVMRAKGPVSSKNFQENAALRDASSKYARKSDYAVLSAANKAEKLKKGRPVKRTYISKSGILVGPDDCVSLFTNGKQLPLLAQVTSFRKEDEDGMVTQFRGRYFYWKQELPEDVRTEYKWGKDEIIASGRKFKGEIATIENLIKVKPVEQFTWGDDYFYRMFYDHDTCSLHPVDHKDSGCNTLAFWGRWAVRMNPFAEAESAYYWETLPALFAPIISGRGNKNKEKMNIWFPVGQFSWAKFVASPNGIRKLFKRDGAVFTARVDDGESLVPDMPAKWTTTTSWGGDGYLEILGPVGFKYSPAGDHEHLWRLTHRPSSSKSLGKDSCGVEVSWILWKTD